jgi:hypothetical protein
MGTMMESTVRGAAASLITHAHNVYSNLGMCAMYHTNFFRFLVCQLRPRKGLLARE